MSIKGQSKKVFSEEFKKNAVEMYKTSGKSAQHVAKQLGIGGSTLSKWVKYYKVENGSLQKNTDSMLHLKQENNRLKKELAQEQVKVEFLKKAVALFSKEAK